VRKNYGQGCAGNEQKQIPPTPFEKKGGRQVFLKKSSVVITDRKELANYF